VSQAFGEKLRSRRLEMGLTLDELARRVGSTKAYVWQLENKRPAKPSGELLLKLAAVLDISAEFLIDDGVVAPTPMQAEIALARGASMRGLSQNDVDRLFKLSEMLDGNKSEKGSN
jgi:transcriptional regulator with XRE-family HTH domain